VTTGDGPAAPRFRVLRRSLGRARRASRKPPRVLAQRVADELRAEADRFLAPSLGRRFDERALLRATASTSVAELWDSVAARPWPFPRGRQDPERYDEALPGDLDRIERLADAAAARSVDLLGTGPTALGRPIDWHVDYLSGRRWPLEYGRRLHYADLGQPTDVKVPWEISRLQWLLPAGQSYALTGNEERARDARDVIDEWIDGNPYALGINWACTMDVALRLLSLTWLFHSFHGSEAWSEPAWRGRFLRSVYLHGLFTERNLERSDVNGNHYTADLLGLVAAGVFFGRGASPERWLRLGWSELEREVLVQVHPDGVDFEASSAYHRLVAEFFLLAVLLRRSVGGSVSEPMLDRLRAMGRFVAAYTRTDGSAPDWGDADDARALPFGGQPTNDHRYLAAAIELSAGVGTPHPRAGAGAAELWWLLGPEAVSVDPAEPESRPVAFPDGGVYILRGPHDHVFADCGPVGLAGRGGHGHNDCLSFEAHLDGRPLLVDCGAYAYTRSIEWRNRFRSTAFHNTPRIDEQEQNRLDPQLLWWLTYDAVPEVLAWRDDPASPLLRAAHRGYDRLSDPVRVERTLALDPQRHVLAVLDAPSAVGEHDVAVPFHLAPGVEVREQATHYVVVSAHDACFVLAWEGEWHLEPGRGWYSPSYGVKQEIARIELRRAGPLRPLLTAIGPGDGTVVKDMLSHARSLVRP
jgi:uncharacterized heparinase superfamily protein